MIAALQISEIVIALLLIAIVLIQNKNVSLNLSSMTGSMGAISKRGPEKVLHIGTIVLGTLFVVNSLLLFVL